MSVTEKDVLAALGEVMDPELNIGLVQAGMVKDIRISGGTVRLKVELATPAYPLKARIQTDVERALRALAGVEAVEVDWGAHVRAGPGSPDGILSEVKNVVLVGAGKGGVGKSTVAMNLAVALGRAGAKVGLLDADFYGPSMPMMAGLLTAKPVSRDGKSLEPLEAHGIKVMSLGFLVEPNQALIWRGPMLHGALTQLVRDVSWGALDYLILDLPPGTGDVVISLSQAVRATGAVLVTTPQDVALADVVRARQMFDKVRIPVLGVVENMSQFVCPHCKTATPIFNHGGGAKAAELFGVDFLGEIPLEIGIRESGDAGVPVVAGRPDSPEAKAFVSVAERVAVRISKDNLRNEAPVQAKVATS